MASYKRIAAGNISNLAQWEMWTGTAWVAAVALPSAADTCYTNGFNSVIDTNWTVTEINNAAFNGTTATGRFEILAAGITFSGFRRCTTLPILFISFGSGTSTVLGSGTTTGGINVLINGLANGILNLENTGTATALYGVGVSMESTGNGFKVIATTVTGGTNTYTKGINIVGSNYILQLQGITQAGNGSGSLGVNNEGVLNTIINNGIVKGCDFNYTQNVGVLDNGSGMCIFINNGILQASTFTRAFISLLPWPGYGALTSAVLIAGGTLIDTAQYNAIHHPVVKLPEAVAGDLAWTLRTATTNRMLYTAGLLTGYPLVAKVESGTVYGPINEYTGTLVPWSPAFAQALATAQSNLQLPAILAAIT